MRPLKKEEELGLAFVGLLLCVVVRYYFGLIAGVIAFCVYAAPVILRIRKSRSNQIKDSRNSDGP